MMNKKFQKMSGLAEEIYGMSCVLKNYCPNYLEIEEIRNLQPMLKHMHKDIDSLNAMFMEE